MGNQREPVEEEDVIVSSWDERLISIKNRSLRFKIKVPKMEQTQFQLNDHMVVDEDNAKNAMEKHVEDDDFSMKRMKTTDENTCCVCGKKFPSVKALYGHMRLHPHRGWKGIRPPRIEKKNRSLPIALNSTGQKKEDRFHMVRRTKGLPDFDGRVPVTARRSLKIAVPAVPSKISQDLLSDAVHNLMLLSSGDTPELDLRKKRKQRGEELDPENGDFMSKKVKTFANLSSEKLDELGVVKKTSEEVKIKNMIYNKPRKQFSYMGSKKMKKRTVRALLIKDSMNHEKKSMVTDRFICSTCNKSFPSHQALGGHRASHKDNIEGDQHAATDPLPGLNNAKSKTGMEQHQCKICNKAFPSGQALGGHQRCHRGGPVEDTVSSVTSQEDNGKIARRQPHDFDLNELPPVEN